MHSAIRAGRAALLAALLGPLLTQIGCTEQSAHIAPALLPTARAPGSGSVSAAALARVESDGEAVEGSATAVITDTRTHAWADPGPWAGEAVDIEEILGEDEIAPHRPRLSREPANSLPLGGVLAEPRVRPGAQFPGVMQTEWAPPDPTIAVGPDHIVATVNMKIAFFDKSGGLQYVNQLNDRGDPGFFEPAGASWFTFDPKCFYDHDARRFVVMAPETYGEDQAWLSIAVSDDADPNGVWYLYRTEAVVWSGEHSFWWDYPGFGYDEKAYYVTSNLFGLNQPGWGGLGVRVFKKQPLLSGGTARYWTLRDARSASAQVAQHFGGAGAPFLVSMASSSRLRVHAVRDPITTPRLVSFDVRIPSFREPTGAPARGGRTIDTIDARPFNAAWRDGQLYTTHHVSRPDGRNVARWYRISTNAWPLSGAPTLAEAGEVEAEADAHAFFPAIYVNRAGQLGMVCGVSGEQSPVAVAVTGRNPGDPPGTMGRPQALKVAGADGGGRWGDYYDIALDPADGRTFWVVGEYPESTGWATWIGAFTVPSEAGPITPCPPDYSGDGRLDTADVVLFLDAWASRDARADFNRDGRVDTADLGEFFSAWASGCP